jgi:hypothetical protein
MNKALHYFRPDSHLYALENNQFYWFRTLSGIDVQLIVGANPSGLVAVDFDLEGNYLGYRPCEIECLEVLSRAGLEEAMTWFDEQVDRYAAKYNLQCGRLLIKRFFIAEHDTGIVDISDALLETLQEDSEALTDPDTGEVYGVEEWLAEGSYVFYWYGADFDMSVDGKVVSS